MAPPKVSLPFLYIYTGMFHIFTSLATSCSPACRKGLIFEPVFCPRWDSEHPRFSKSLLLQDLQVDPDVGRMNAGSCSFDLLVRLGLFPGQPNETLAEYDTKVPLDAVISRGNCYCGRISRHGFVFLVSK